MPNERVLQKQAQKINELSSMLETLLVDAKFCHNRQCCKLFSKYTKQLKDHSKSVEKSIYSELLLSNNGRFNRIADDFIQSSEYMKRSLKQFSRRWWDCPEKCFKLATGQNDLSVKNHRLLVADLSLLFNISAQHLNREKRILYPAIQDIRETKAA